MMQFVAGCIVVLILIIGVLILGYVIGTFLGFNMTEIPY